jgi:hypothetical protein
VCPRGFELLGFFFRWEWAGVAQLVEHLICNQRVGGSNPFASSTIEKGPFSFEDGKMSFAGVLLFLAGPVLRGDPTEVHAPNHRTFSGRGLMR